MAAESFLPALREELELMPGPRTPNGEPTWTLRDPARNQFFQLDWPTFEILKRWHLKNPERIVAAIRAETCLDADPDDVLGVGEFLRQNQLLAVAPGAAREFARLAQKRRGSLAAWLLHNYLFFRIPLFKPDRWLTACAPHLDIFFGARFLQLTIIAGVLGLASIVREWERYAGTLVDMLSWQGLLAYGITLTGVKVLHELGHGFTAKRHGCRVPTMGVAFLVLWPVAYTDTNEVWKLTRRDQRLQVAAAGIATELAIAAWATLAWMWLPEGGLKTAAFLLSSTTWVLTLAINASPFMRFDGYFLLSDYLRMPNLHARAFALARWDLRERLFGFGEPPPEHFPSRRRLGLLLFAWATWIYRLFVFLGIAVLVYHFFIKAVGILLFLVEIVWFVLWPVWQELRIWWEHWELIRASRRGRRSLAALGLVVLLFLVPWPSRVGGAGLLGPVSAQAVYSPERAQITAFLASEGSRVEAGSQLAYMTSPEIVSRASMAGARIERLSWQSAAAGFDADQKKDWQLLNGQLELASAERTAVNADAVPYNPHAAFSGVLRDTDPDLRPDDWLAAQELLGRIVGSDGLQVVSYVEEEDIRRIAIGDRGLFIADGMAGPNARLKVVQIDRDSSRTLAEGELAGMFGGNVLVREKNGVLFPERAIYKVTLQVVDLPDAGQHRWRGQVAIAGGWEAPGWRFLRHAVSVFWREAGF